MAKIVHKVAAFDGGAGNISVVAAVAGKKIAVHGYVLVGDTANGTFRWEDGSGGTALSGVIEISIDSPIVVPHSPVAWFTTSVNTALNLEATATGGAGHIIYTEVGE